MERENHAHISCHLLFEQSRKLRQDSQELIRRGQELQRRIHALLTKHNHARELLEEAFFVSSDTTDKPGH